MKLQDETLYLSPLSVRENDPARPGLVTCSFRICLSNGETVGTCEVRVGALPPCLRHTGHVSYTVFPRYRGHGYAARALCLLRSFAAEKGMDSFTVTSMAENLPSRRTCESAGGVFSGTLPLPGRPSRVVCVYVFSCTAADG